jgi:hypothetical protein
LVVDVRYYRRSYGNSLFAYATAGYSIKISDASSTGMHGGINVGLKFGAARRSPILISVGYELHQINEPSIFLYGPNTSTLTYVNTPVWLKSISINLALLF